MLLDGAVRRVFDAWERSIVLFSRSHPRIIIFFHLASRFCSFSQLLSGRDQRNGQHTRSIYMTRMENVSICFGQWSAADILRAGKGATFLFGEDARGRHKDPLRIASRFGFLIFWQTVGRRGPAEIEPNMSLAEATFSSAFCCRMNYRGGVGRETLRDSAEQPQRMVP